MNSWNLQRAIYNELISDAPLMAMVEGVFDHVDQGQSYPYIVIGEGTNVDFDDDLELGNEATINIHIWSQYKGRMETKQIMDEIYQVLHRADLVIDGSRCVKCDFEFGDSFMDPDGETRHGVMRFRLIYL